MTYDKIYGWQQIQIRAAEQYCLTEGIDARALIEAHRAERHNNKVLTAAVKMLVIGVILSIALIMITSLPAWTTYGIGVLDVLIPFLYYLMMRK